MNKKEFCILLEKAGSGTLTPNEQIALDAYLEEVVTDEKTVVFKDDLHKNQIKEAIWSEIDLKTKPTKTLWRKMAAAAAIFVGLLAIGALYVQFGDEANQKGSFENTITLKLHDGTIQSLEEGVNTVISNNNGDVVVRQQKNQLIYTNDDAMTEIHYNTLSVPYGKTFKVLLSDGTTAHLNAGSSLKYPIHFVAGKERKVFISGEAYLDVAKDAKHPFIVNANNLDIRVLGTQFNVSAYEEDRTTDVVLVEGSVSLYASSNTTENKNPVLLEPGDKGSFSKAKQAITKKEVNTKVYTSWIGGELMFRNMTFKNILRKLERHYNVTIIAKNTTLTEKVFNANFGKEPIENVMEELKTNYGINYSRIGDQIVIE